MENSGAQVDAFDALAIANEAGSSKAVNIALMGKLSKKFDFTEEQWLDALEKCVPERFIELNKKAFKLARES